MAVSLSQLAQQTCKTRSVAPSAPEVDYMPPWLLKDKQDHSPRYSSDDCQSDQLLPLPPKSSKSIGVTIAVPTEIPAISPLLDCNASPPVETPRQSPSSEFTSIQPDPLPPHSNPQVLTRSQTYAFEDSKRIPTVRISKEDVCSAEDGKSLFHIRRDAAHLPKILSTRPLLTVTETVTGTTVGTIRFHTVSSNRIDLIVDGYQTAMTHSGLMHNRWGFQTKTRADAGAKWYWKPDKSTGGAKLDDSKTGGNVLARMKGDMLAFEKGRMSDGSYVEVLVSAIAMAEAARRQKRHGDIIASEFARTHDVHGRERGSTI